jgi:hypothetical protein
MTILELGEGVIFCMESNSVRKGGVRTRSRKPQEEGTWMGAMEHA